MRVLLIILSIGIVCGAIILYPKMAYAIPSLGITKACGEILPVKTISLKAPNPYLEAFKKMGEKDVRFNRLCDHESQSETAPKYDPLIEKKENVLNITDYRPETLVFLVRGASGRPDDVEKAYTMAVEDVRKKSSVFSEVKNRKKFGWPLKTFGGSIIFIDSWALALPFTYSEPLLDPTCLFGTPIGPNIDDPKTWRD